MNGLSAPLRSPREEAPVTAGHGIPWPAAGASRGVITTVFFHELRLLAGSFRLWAPALLLLALMMLAALAAAARHRAEMEEQAEVERVYAQKLAGITLDDLVEVRHPALKPPWRLALVVDGGQAATPDTYAEALSALEEPSLGRAAGEVARLPRTAPLDWMLAIRIVLSISAFLLCYGAVCGERQAGTLKLLFSFPVPRWKLLAGKFLASWTCLAVPFLAGTGLSLLVVVSLGDLQPAEGDLIRAGLGILLGLWAAAFFVLVALLVSSLTRDPSTSLGILALLWVAAVVAVPALGGLLARRLQPLPTDAEVNQRMSDARRQAEREVPGQGGRWRGSGWAAADGYSWEKLSALTENRRAALQEEVRRESLDAKLRQASLARTLGSVSPPSLLQGIAERLLGTGLDRDRAFLEQAAAFHSALRERVRQLDAADPESPHIRYFRGYMSRRPLAAGSLPRFRFSERTLREGIESTRAPLLIFAVETFLLAMGAVFAFSRYDAG